MIQMEDHCDTQISSHPAALVFKFLWYCVPLGTLYNATEVHLHALACPPPHTHTHTCTHAHTHMHVHAHTHTNTHTPQTNTHTQANKKVCVPHFHGIYLNLHPHLHVVLYSIKKYL